MDLHNAILTIIAENKKRNGITIPFRFQIESPMHFPVATYGNNSSCPTKKHHGGPIWHENL